MVINTAVHTGQAVTAREIKDSDADEVILATGSRPKMLKVADISMLTAEDVLTGKADPGKAAVVIGGGLVGCETALWLKKEKGIDAFIVELQPSILSVGGPLCSANKDMLEDLLAFHQVDIMTGSCVTGKNDEGYIVKTPEGERTIAADSVICAVGYMSEKSLYEEVKETMPYVHLLGDAGKVSNIMYAVWNAYELARGI